MSSHSSPNKKRAKAYFRLAMSALLSFALTGLFALQLMAPSGKTLPMWLFGVLCVALICFIADTALGARRDFDEARFLDSQARQAKASAGQPLEAKSPDA